jgi:hypothetical protein
MPDESGNHYHFEIILPGTIPGIIVGFATQKYGKLRARKAGPDLNQLLITNNI